MMNSPSLLYMPSLHTRKAQRRNRPPEYHKLYTPTRPLNNQRLTISPHSPGPTTATYTRHESRSIPVRDLRGFCPALPGSSLSNQAYGLESASLPAEFGSLLE